MTSHPPTWFDWITVAAIFVGPVFALLAQRVLDWMRAKKQRRLQLYFTAMTLRGSWLHPDSVRALNSIDTVFDRERDKPVRDAWAAVIKHANTIRPDWQTHPDECRLWDAHLWDLRVDLYQMLGTAVGYDHSIDYIKNQLYVPKGFVDMEMEQMLIRKQFGKILTDDGLKVIVNS
ncbi:MAG: DUF6680 family protein [Terriglobales bacterium]|jgi:hypothetical protein